MITNSLSHELHVTFTFNVRIRCVHWDQQKHWHCNKNPTSEMCRKDNAYQCVLHTYMLDRDSIRPPRNIRYLGRCQLQCPSLKPEIIQILDSETEAIGASLYENDITLLLLLSLQDLDTNEFCAFDRCNVTHLCHNKCLVLSLCLHSLQFSGIDPNWCRPNFVFSSVVQHCYNRTSHRKIFKKKIFET